uniref:Putative secreted protein n=1 Tax=Anopheles marajoara TaxID=58244 RepID=A0A2M4C7Z4_9DIPT
MLLLIAVDLQQLLMLLLLLMSLRGCRWRLRRVFFLLLLLRFPPGVVVRWPEQQQTTGRPTAASLTFACATLGQQQQPWTGSTPFLHYTIEGAGEGGIGEGRVVDWPPSAPRSRGRTGERAGLLLLFARA